MIKKYKCPLVIMLFLVLIFITCGDDGGSSGGDSVPDFEVTFISATQTDNTSGIIAIKSKAEVG